MSTQRKLHDPRDLIVRNIGPDVLQFLPCYDLLHSNDDLVRGLHGQMVSEVWGVKLHIPLTICPVGMDDGHVWPQGRQEIDFFATEGARHLTEVGTQAEHLGAGHYRGGHEGHSELGGPKLDHHGNAIGFPDLDSARLSHPPEIGS